MVERQAPFSDVYGPVALVTGATSGIGRAFADVLAARGMDLVLAARRIDLLDRIADDLSAAHGIRVIPVEVDLAQPDAPMLLAGRTIDLDVGLVVSNAGFSMKGAHADNDPDMMTRMLMVNCHAPLQLTRAFIPRLRARGRSGIVLTASVEALMGCPYSGAYSASKALVKALGEALWAELREDGVDVLTLCPGATETEGLVRSGFDPAKMPHVSKAVDVAKAALDHLADGPVFIASAHYRAMFEGLLTLPRQEALTAMAAGIKAAAK